MNGSSSFPELGSGECWPTCGSLAPGSSKATHSIGFCGVALLLAAMFSHGSTAAWCLVFCGLANSIMYPTIFALGIAELGAADERGLRRDHHRQRGRRRDSAAVRLDRGQAGLQLYLHRADSLLPLCLLLRIFRVQASAQGPGVGKSRPGADYGIAGGDPPAIVRCGARA